MTTCYVLKFAGLVNRASRQPVAMVGTVERIEAVRARPFHDVHTGERFKTFRPGRKGERKNPYPKVTDVWAFDGTEADVTELLETFGLGDGLQTWGVPFVTLTPEAEAWLDRHGLTDRWDRCDAERLGVKPPGVKPPGKPRRSRRLVDRRGNV